MRTVESKTLVGVVKNGVVHVAKADDKRVFAKVRITTNTAKSSKKIEAILSAFKAYPNFSLVAGDITSALHRLDCFSNRFIYGWLHCRNACRKAGSSGVARSSKIAD
jgi:hypothetical protein